MSAISGIDTGVLQTQNISKSDETSMGKDDFLMLLVTQLKNQDPMNPQDASEFASQLAQFSSLEQLTNIDKNLDGLTTMSDEMERMSALGLIGRNVVAQTENFHYSGDALQLGYRLESPADDVKLYVLSETGSTLATISPEETSSGDHFINWDGISDFGMPLEPGDYSLVIRATEGDDSLVNAAGLVAGQVEGVDMSGLVTQLETSSGVFSMDKIEKAGTSL